MLSRTQYNVYDYFKKCVDSTFHLGMGFNTIASTLICWKSKTLIPGVLPSARFVTILSYTKRTWRWKPCRGKVGVANFWELRIEPSNRLYNKSYS